jgi:hypothetical protein
MRKIQLPPLSADGRVLVEVYGTPLMVGHFLLSSWFMDRFRFPSCVKPYGEGDDLAVGGFAQQNRIPMVFIRPPSMPDWMSKNDYLISLCPEHNEYQDWKVGCMKLKMAEIKPFKPSRVGNDTTDLKIRKDLICNGVCNC